MRTLLGTATLAALLVACGASNSEDSAPPADKTPEVELVQERYGDCLKRLEATNAELLVSTVYFDTKKGPLYIDVKERDGKTYTFPMKAADTRKLASVGC